MDRNLADFNIGSPKSASALDLERAPVLVLTVDEEAGFPELTTYHAKARLMDGRPALLVDPGSVGILRGDTWAKSVATAAAKAGHKVSYTKRERPFNVKGAGKGAQQRKFDCALPIALRNSAGDSVTSGL